MLFSLVDISHDCSWIALLRRFA